jgi:hypothetical protein
VHFIGHRLESLLQISDDRLLVSGKSIQKTQLLQ